MTTNILNGVRQRAVPWAWAGLTLAGLVVALLVAFGVVAALQQWDLVGGAGVQPALRFDLALLLAVFGGLGMAAVVGTARLAFGRWAEVKALDVLLPVAGIAIAIAEELALHGWAQASIGFYDTDFVGATALFSLLVVLIAMAGFGIRVAPRGMAHPAVTAGACAAVLIAAIVASNLPSLRDGIGPHSWPLVITMGLSVAYVVVVAGVAIRSVAAR